MELQSTDGVYRQPLLPRGCDTLHHDGSIDVDAGRLGMIIKEGRVELLVSELSTIELENRRLLDDDSLRLVAEVCVSACKIDPLTRGIGVQK